MKKSLFTISGILFTLIMIFTSFARTGWIQTNGKWKYSTNETNTQFFHASGADSTIWGWIDGNGDGVKECYAFDKDGIMYEQTTTKDGYTVNSDGAWTVKGQIQYQSGTKINAVGKGWKNENGAWKYSISENDCYKASSTLKPLWVWIDGNNDGYAESYAFDPQGRLYTSTLTPDGFTVNSSGAWIVNGQIQYHTSGTEEAKDDNIVTMPPRPGTGSHSSGKTYADIKLSDMQKAVIKKNRTEIVSAVNNIMDIGAVTTVTDDGVSVKGTIPDSAYKEPASKAVEMATAAIQASGIDTSTLKSVSVNYKGIGISASGYEDALDQADTYLDGKTMKQLRGGSFTAEATSDDSTKIKVTISLK